MSRFVIPVKAGNQCLLTTFDKLNTPDIFHETLHSLSSNSLIQFWTTVIVVIGVASPTRWTVINAAHREF